MSIRRNSSIIAMYATNRFFLNIILWNKVQIIKINDFNFLCVMHKFLLSLDFFTKFWKRWIIRRIHIFSHPNPFSCWPFKNFFSSGAARADYEDFPPTRRAFPLGIWLMSLTLIDVARYKSLIEQSCLCTIRYFDRPDSFCNLVTWPIIISDDTLTFLFNICNIANF